MMMKIFTNSIKDFKCQFKIRNNKITELLKITNMTKNSGGETEIRTQERVAPLPVFKTGAFNRSAISPLVSVLANNLKFSTKKLLK